MPPIKLLVLVLLTITTANSFSQTYLPFQENDLNYKYDVGSLLKFDYRNYFQDDSVHILFSFTFNEKPGTNWFNNFNFYLSYREDYKNPEILKNDTLQLDQYLIGVRQNTYFFSKKIPRNDTYGLIEFSILSNNPDINYLFDINLNEGANYSNDHIEMYDANDGLPILDNFILTGQQVEFRQSTNDVGHFWAYFYDSDFDVAVPPMIVDNNNASRSLNVTKTIMVQKNTPISFQEEGLYFIQSDTSSLEGLAFRVQAPPYPKFGTYENLLKPLKYISTKEESEILLSNNNKKAAFENYWFTLLSSHNLAQNSIKDFYNKIYEANFYFTGYKEGWKTDMGMVYTIYGQPNKVFKHDEYEEWIFNQNVNMPAIRFTFVKIKNVFADNHYTLVRDRKFDKHWFRAVELWRSGKR